MHAAAQSFKNNTVPGRDQITNAIIRNLSYRTLCQLMDFFNEKMSANGQVPREWKEAEITLIPKLGRTRNLQNLRPVSLTSCMGKLFEKSYSNAIWLLHWDAPTILQFNAGLSTACSSTGHLPAAKQRGAKPPKQEHRQVHPSLGHQKGFRHHIPRNDTRGTMQHRMWRKDVQLHKLFFNKPNGYNRHQLDLIYVNANTQPQKTTRLDSIPTTI